MINLSTGPIIAVHTPGPWLCHKYPDTKGHTISHYKLGSIASVKHPDPETQAANARLVAAAPDLFFAVRMVQLDLATAGLVTDATAKIMADLVAKIQGE